jgi:tetratricopeptide (TPR) repeat protein
VSGSRSRELRDRLQKALLKGRFADALGYYTVLERMEADEPRWPHRKGDLLRRLGRADDAVDSYERAVDLYAQRGFVARAAAMAKLVIAMDPSRADVLQRVTPVPARKLHRAARRAVVTADPNRALDASDTTDEKQLSAEAFPLVQTKGPAEMSRVTQRPGTRPPDLDIAEIELVDQLEQEPEGASERPPAEHLARKPSAPAFSLVPPARAKKPA